MPVLHTAVTSAPSALAICTANVPASERPVDQHLLPGLEPALVAEPLQGRDRGHGHGRSLLERHAGRLRHDGVTHADVLGERSVPGAVDGVALARA